MIVIKFCGGLGNQMYQYAFGLKLQKIFPKCVIKRDIRDFKITAYHQGYELDRIFRNPADFSDVSIKELKILRGEIPVLLDGKINRIAEPVRKMVNHLFFPLKNENIWDEKDISGLQVIEKLGHFCLKHDIYLQGFWADINLYLDEQELLFSNFKFPDFVDKRNREVKERMKGSQSVSVHVRRGDYVNSQFEVVSLEYYKKAIMYMENIMSDPQYYFFSDDIEYVEKNFEFLKNKTVVNWNRGKESWCDMCLMSYCKSNIIVNSTFSQWGALLNPNKTKIVIYPNKRMKNVEMEEILLPGWRKIEV